MIITSRKLKPYFSTYPINVLINVSLRHISHKPDIYGRISKWAFELNKYQIDFSPPKIVQGQALADFLVECSFLESSSGHKSKVEIDDVVTRTLNVDGSAGEKYKSDGFILKNLMVTNMLML